MALLLIPGYLCYKIFLENINTEQTEEDEKEEESEEASNTQEIITDLPIEDISFEEGEHYKEDLPVIDDQQAYVLSPKKINTSDPVTLVIYSHGSNTNVTQDFEDPFMKDLQSYGILFTQHNYIFAASNQHGMNWGNEASIRDIQNLINWVSQRFNIQPQIDMIGFSMGGLPTMNFASQNPDMINKIALLAPTARSSEWNKDRAANLKNMDIKIWHGTKDVNIPITSSITFVNKMSQYGIDIELEQIEGKTHFDVDAEYMDNILEYFES